MNELLPLVAGLAFILREYISEHFRNTVLDNCDTNYNRCNNDTNDDNCNSNKKYDTNNNSNSNDNNDSSNCNTDNKNQNINNSIIHFCNS